MRPPRRGLLSRFANEARCDVSFRLVLGFAGTSTGANLVAALRLAAQLGSGKTIGTVACDTGLKYLSTDLYSVR